VRKIFNHVRDILNLINRYRGFVGNKSTKPLCFKKVKETINQYIISYNEQRYQEKLKGLTPMEYRNQALNQLNI
jgi:hypothetical protein